MMARKETIVLCGECRATLLPTERERGNRYCKVCIEAHKSAWCEEHTRQGPEDKRCGWLIDDICRVTIKGITYNHARILDMSDISVADKHNYELVKLELTRTVTDLGGKEHTYKWVHPEPVQTYKLRKPLLEED